MRFAFIEEHRDAFCAQRMCDVLGVSARGLRAYRRRPASRRQRTDMVLLAHIKEQSRLSLGSYGRPRMTEELKDLGLAVGHRRVGRLMRENAITVKRNRKFKATTDSNHLFNISPNLLGRDFSADHPNQKWAGAREAEPRRSRRTNQLCLDPGGLTLSGGHSRSAFQARHWLGCQ